MVADRRSGARLDPIDRANLEYVAATASGDAADRTTGVGEVDRGDPGEREYSKELGEMRFARREFQQAAMEYRAGAHLDPDEAQNWNELGYALAWAEGLERRTGGAGAISEAGARGCERAGLARRGQLLCCGDFKAADGYFEQAAAKNPAELLKAAEAAHDGGSAGRGRAVCEALGARQRGRHDGASFQMAQWEYLTGRRKAGYGSDGEVGSGVGGRFAVAGVQPAARSGS